MVADNHIRGIAKDLDTNQTLILRKIKELEDRNVVDFKFFGKNKVYSLKDTIEAKEEIMILEHYKLIEIINVYPRLRYIVEMIKKRDDVYVAVLFGSYAKMSANDRSDIDIYIDNKIDIEKIDSKISAKYGVFDKDSYLAKEIIKNHVIIKGVEKFYDVLEKNEE
jgi:predicted nucleotidyltransferase